MRFALLLIVMLSPPMLIAAQTPTIPPGTRVKVQTQQNTRVNGSLISQSSDSIIVATGDAMRTVIASDAVTRIDVSKGRSHLHGAVRGMKVGAVTTGGVVTLIFAVAYIGSRAEDMSIAPFFAYTAVSAAIGAMYGAAIGGMFGAERWSTVYSAPIQVTFRPSQGAPGAGVSIRF
jgi:hypothetical protein